MFEVTMRDIKEARRCLAQDAIKRSGKGVFRGILFCLLSIGQLYKTQRTIYNTLVRCGLDSVEAIRDREQITKAIVWSARFPSSMWGYVRDLCARWPENAEFFRENFVLRGPEDVEDVHALRDELVKRVKGFGYKVASLFLCLWGVCCPKCKPKHVDQPDEDILYGAVRRITVAVLELWKTDVHEFTTRPCATCRAISELLGVPWGCIALVTKKRYTHEFCTWEAQEVNYKTTCGVGYPFNFGKLAETHFTYCPYCGQPLRVWRVEETEREV